MHHSHLTRVHASSLRREVSRLEQERQLHVDKQLTEQEVLELEQQFVNSGDAMFGALASRYRCVPPNIDACLPM